MRSISASSDSVARLHLNGVLLAGAHIFRRNLQNAVGINQETYLNTRQTSGRRRNFQCKPRQRTAVLSQFAFALQNVNVDARLVIDASGVLLLRTRRNRRVARNNFGHRTAVRLDTQEKAA